MTGEDEGGVVFNLCDNEDDFCYGVFLVLHYFIFLYFGFVYLDCLF